MNGRRREREDRARLRHAYPAITSMPRSTASRASASGSAEPPMTTFQPKSVVTVGMAQHHLRMVGTQWENVTPSSR
jgi:hypothetical protein